MRERARWGTMFMTAVALSAGLMVAGCDYWPPALQAQIEQLRQEAQQTSTERLKLESQLMDARKERDQVQSRLDELSRSNQALSAEIAKLETALTNERDKVAKMTKAAPAPKVAAKPAAKSTSKSATKSTAKKKTTKKTVPRRGA